MSLEPRILQPSEWDLVRPIVTGTFKDAMPKTPLQATFPALMDGDKLAAFVHVETLFHFASFYVAPEYRGKGLVFEIAREAARRIPEGFSACVLTDEPTVARIAKTLGARDVGRWQYLRKDF